MSISHEIFWENLQEIKRSFGCEDGEPTDLGMLVNFALEYLDKIDGKLAFRSDFKSQITKDEFFIKLSSLFVELDEKNLPLAFFAINDSGILPGGHDSYIYFGLFFIFLGKGSFDAVVSDPANYESIIQNQIHQKKSDILISFDDYSDYFIGIEVVDDKIFLKEFKKYIKPHMSVSGLPPLFPILKLKGYSTFTNLYPEINKSDLSSIKRFSRGIIGIFSIIISTIIYLLILAFLILSAYKFLMWVWSAFFMT